MPNHTRQAVGGEVIGLEKDRSARTACARCCAIGWTPGSGRPSKRSARTCIGPVSTWSAKAESVFDKFHEVFPRVHRERRIEDPLA